MLTRESPGRSFGELGRAAFYSGSFRKNRVSCALISREAEVSIQVPGWGPGYRLRQQLYPACGMFAMLGLVVGMGARFLLPLETRRGSRPYWLFVILAGMAAVLIAALPFWPALIAYLVLIALEAVTNAMYHPYPIAMHERLIPQPGFSTRLLHAGLDAAVAAGFCLALAVAVARDFERLRQGKPWATKPAGWAFRFLLLAGAAAAGVYIAVVTIPMIHPWFAEGFRQVLGPIDAAAIVCCFGLFGAGMAARAIAGPTQSPMSLWVSRISRVARLAIIGTVLFAVLNNLPDPTLLESRSPPLFTSVVAFIREFLNSFWKRFPDSLTADAIRLLAIENLLWTSMMLTIACFTIELFVRDDSSLTSPFDQLAESPAAARGFAWLALGFTVLCLAALPTLIVAGQALLHLHMHAGDLTSRRWAF